MRKTDKIAFGFFIVLVITSSCKMLGIENNINKEINSVKGMVYVPAGEFILGSDERFVLEDNSNNRKVADAYSIAPFVLSPLPEKKIFLDGFYISILEVTNREYQHFIEDGGYQKREFWSEDGWSYIKKMNISIPEYWMDGEEYHSGPGFPDYPVVGVTWYEAQAYAKWAGKRLPTEEEWEKAARATDGRVWPWGNKFSESRLNSYETGLKGSVPVGLFVLGTSPFQIMDMAGNVLEWTSTRYNGPSLEQYPYNDEAILRGGSWRYSSEFAKSMTRIRHWVGERAHDCSKSTGFRLARDKRQQINM